MSQVLLSIPGNGIAGATSAQSYTQYTYSYTATSSLTALIFQFEQDPSFWDLDDVTFSSSGSNLLTNAGFEDGNLTGWTLVGQSGQAVGGSVISGSGQSQTGSSHTGTYYFADGTTRGCYVLSRGAGLMGMDVSRAGPQAVSV